MYSVSQSLERGVRGPEGSFLTEILFWSSDKAQRNGTAVRYSIHYLACGCGKL